MKKRFTAVIIGLLVLCLSACISNTTPELNNEGENSCIVSIDCKTILDNKDKLAAGKEVFVPDDGMILDDFEVRYSGESNSFEILQKACALNNIQMEFTDSAIGSKYIEGINQIYEFDCGSLSGWQFFINDKYVDVGAGEAKVSPGDRISWRYTCNMGEDLGAKIADQ